MNDLGFRRRADMLEWDYALGAQKQQPFSIFRRAFLQLYGWQQWNYDKINISRHLEVWTSIRFKNYWDSFLSVARNFESFSDDDVRRGGALIRNPANWGVSARLSTDSRKMIRLELSPFFTWNDDKTILCL